MNTLEFITKSLNAYGLDSEQISTENLVTRISLERPNIELDIQFQLTEHWVGITIWPFLPAPTEQQACIFAQCLCRSNYEIKMARLAQNSAGEAVLCIDIPVPVLSEALLQLALDVLVYYATDIYQQLAQPGE